MQFLRKLACVDTFKAGCPRRKTSHHQNQSMHLHKIRFDKSIPDLFYLLLIKENSVLNNTTHMKAGIFAQWRPVCQRGSWVPPEPPKMVAFYVASSNCLCENINQKKSAATNAGCSLPKCERDSGTLIIRRSSLPAVAPASQPVRLNCPSSWNRAAGIFLHRPEDRFNSRETSAPELFQHTNDTYFVCLHHTLLMTDAFMQVSSPLGFLNKDFYQSALLSLWMRAVTCFQRAIMPKAHCLRRSFTHCPCTAVTVWQLRVNSSFRFHRFQLTLT